MKISEKIKKRLFDTTDLWEVDKLGAYVEDNMDELTDEEYDIFHSDLVHKWISQNWKSIKFDGKDLKSTLYNKYIPKFENHLKEMGYKSDLILINYLPLAEDENDDYSGHGEFLVIFNTFKDNERGWTSFKFNIPNYIDNILLKETKIFESYSDVDDYLDIDIDENIKSIMVMGKFNTEIFDDRYTLFEK